MSSVFSLLDEKLQNELEKRSWQPTPIQESAIPQIIDGKDRLLIAPTGSGKTLSAILPVINRCLVEQWEPLSILYVTPLRALNRDVDRRLQEIAESVGLRVGLRHGDTTQSERAKQVRKPPDILITTPETFQLMFTGKNLRELLKTVKAIIIDEVHDLAASERGWQLSLGLSRLETLSGNKVQRIGLSATVGNPHQVAKWLSNDGETIMETGKRVTEIVVETAFPETIDETGGIEYAIPSRAHAIFRDIIEIIRKDSPCLLFVNSRSDAETIANRLQKMAPELDIGVHHGSLATETRIEMEDGLRSGKVSGLVCTSSLELGIDIGLINRIIQIKSPRSVDRLLQRVGRADHRLGGIGRGNIFAWDCDELSEAAVIGERAMRGELEPVIWRNMPRTVVVNQLILMAHSFKAITIDEATAIIAKAPQFEGWQRDDTIEILAVIADNWLVKLVTDPKGVPWYRWPKSIYEESQLLPENKGIILPEERPLFKTPEEEIDAKIKGIELTLPKRYETGWFSVSGRTRDWVSKHLSMIPDKQSYRVRDSVTRRSIGSVDEAFVLSLNDSGEEEDGAIRRFVIAGRTWMIIDADPEKSELLVVPVSDQAKAPQWLGELPPVPAEVARDIGRLRWLIAEDLKLIESSKLANSSIDRFNLLASDEIRLTDFPINEHALGMLSDEIGNHMEKSGVLPTDRKMTIEARNDAIIINSCQGTKINETLGHLILAMASTKSGNWGRLIIESTRIGLQASGVAPEDIISWLTETPPDALEGLLSVTLPNSRQLRWRFAQVGKTFGILRHGVDPRRINLQALIRKYRGTVVLREVLDKLFFEKMDLEGASDVLRAIQEGVISIEVAAAGPIGLSRRSSKDLLLPNWDNAAVRERLSLRLENERAVLCCLKCQSVRRFRVARYNEIPDIGICLKCKGRMLACAREGLLSMLKDWVSSDEAADRNRMIKNAEIVQNRGQEAILCLMGRGIGEATAQRILRKVPRNNRDKLLKTIHLAEVEYARTRRFWG